MTPLHVRFLSGSRQGQTVIFRYSPVRAGRSRTSDLLLPESDDPRASAHHAEFVYEDGHWWVVDLGSTNGTLRNGHPVQRAALANRDRLSFGDQQVEIRTRAQRPYRRTAAALLLAVLVAALGWLSWRAPESPLDRIAAAGRTSVYLLVIEDEGRRTSVGTAFAVGRRTLGTTAHVAALLAAPLAGEQPRPRVLGLSQDGPTRQITAVRLHPQWKPGSVENDVAVVEVDGPPLAPLRLAGEEGVRRLAPGETVAIFGFPAAFTDVDEPRGTLAVNRLHEVRGRSYLVIGVAVTAGSSGSPVFTSDGLVVGLIAGSGLPRAPGGTGEHANPAVALGVSTLRELLN